MNEPNKQKQSKLISRAEFESKLAGLCLRRGTPGLPRKQRDRDTLFTSIILTLDKQKAYTEKRLGEALKKWLDGVAKALETDHVSLRRHLVDEGYLSRDPEGKVYRVLNIDPSASFEMTIRSIDTFELVEIAQKERQKKRQLFFDNQTNANS